MDRFTEATIATYNRTAEQYARNVAGMHHADIASRFLEFIPPKGNILDLGCGSGRDAKVFSEKGYKVIGIDLSEKLLEIAKKEAPRARFQYMDMRRLEFSNETFSGIWSVASVLHLPKLDVLQCLSECNRVLKSNGAIYIGVKLGIGEEFKPDTRYAEDAFKFYSYFQEGEMENLLQRAKFEILDSTSKETFKEYLQHKEIRVLAKKS
jgi:ubiquinone/menaquinone biosynthesis C-methylase UbiE